MQRRALRNDDDFRHQAPGKKLAANGDQRWHSAHNRRRLAYMLRNWAWPVIPASVMLVIMALLAFVVTLIIVATTVLTWPTLCGQLSLLVKLKRRNICTKTDRKPNSFWWSKHSIPQKSAFAILWVRLED